MSIFRMPELGLFKPFHVVRDRGELERYLDTKPGRHLKAWVMTNAIAEGRIQPEDGVSEPDVCRSGRIFRHEVDETQVISFLPTGWGVGEAEEERFGFSLKPEDSLPIQGMSLIVRQRRDVSVDPVS